jgi:hydroxyacylglutathione hydrolase
VDAPDGAAIIREAERRGWRLTHLLLTHHHADHVQGTEALRARNPDLLVAGAAGDAHRLPPLDVAVADGDTLRLGESRARVFETPGHTLGHVVYHFPDDAIAFVGDTLFSLGCGRVFEGTMPMMRRSLETIARLPDETRIYCGHEYTQSNGRFAATVDPENPRLMARLRAVADLRAAGQFTLPTTIAEEKATNPFLRATDAGIRRAMGLTDADADVVFGEMRARKNRFAA